MRPRVKSDNPVEVFLSAQGYLILDGGLATELEARGCDLTDDLWSARILLEQPDLIRQVHLDYLHSGADCIVSASYQATVEGFGRRGLSVADSEGLLRRSVELAREARDDFWADPANRRGRLRPLVAASVGPYGAYLADGSEFRGDYGLNEKELADFHRFRWDVLAASGADLMACETMPSLVEVRALQGLLEDTDGIQAWFSFSCGSGSRLNDGTSIQQVVRELEGSARIVAVGVNCTSPQYISSLIGALRAECSKPIVVYPNSGELWNPRKRIWLDASADDPAWVELTGKWVEEGARLVGGCCRTRPADIAAVRSKLLG